MALLTDANEEPLSDRKERALPAPVAYTGRQVEKLTGLSERVLRYWEETDVFRATYVDDLPRRPYRRIYSFRDVVSLRTLAILRRDHKVKLEELRRVGQYLTRFYQAPWAELGFRVAGRHVAFRDPDTGEWVSGKPLGQRFIAFDLEDVRRTTEAEASELNRRRPDDIGRLVRHRHVVQNSWVVAGTRVPASAIWNFHEAGYDVDRILQAYPRLTEEDVCRALDHERRLRAAAA
ncbi:MAG: hypothetical protein QOG89_1471 [Thermomicrobiales bacterium]|nr:hypothetical protein [Thermomicrobiales bacterium]